jgi:hypothetical protein
VEAVGSVERFFAAKTDFLLQFFAKPVPTPQPLVILYTFITNIQLAVEHDGFTGMILRGSVRSFPRQK